MSSRPTAATTVIRMTLSMMNPLDVAGPAPRSAVGSASRSMFGRVQLADAVHFRARLEVLELIQLPHFDFSFGLLAERRREAPRPFHGFFAGANLNQPVAGDPYLAFREPTVDQRALARAVVDAPAFRTRLQPGCVEEHTGLGQFFMVGAHRSHQGFVRRAAGFADGRRLHYDHESHRNRSLGGVR